MTEAQAERQGSSRREFLVGAGAGVAAALTPAGRASAAPAPYQARVFPLPQAQVPGHLFPEQAIERYSAAAGQWGVAFSGGGTRAFSAALGQMRGLRAAGVLDDIGAISCVSGGSWFGVPFTFAPEGYTDTALLGPLVSPTAISVEELEAPTDSVLGSLVQNLSDPFLLAQLYLLKQEVDLNLLPENKIYARMLNAALLAPLDLGDTVTPFTLNQASALAVMRRNPGLRAFHLPRRGRPFLIAGGTQIIEHGKARQTPVRRIDATRQTFRNIEYTPLYVGATPLVTPDRGAPYGGGFVESFAFDTPQPLSVSNDIVTVPRGQYPFLLSDVIGSSSAAFEYETEDRFGTPSIFPEFDYWPIDKIGGTPSIPYAFGDGGTLDNSGVISLLRRQYKTIFAFANSGFPVGSTSTQCVGGLDGMVSRLFGYIPENNLGKTVSNHVFHMSQFAALAAGLAASHARGGPAVYVDTFEVRPDNKFGVPPYKPRIFWIYNDRNEDWFGQLKRSVKELVTAPLDKYKLRDFPNYKTVGQNGELDPLYLTPTQVNLMAHMWAYTVKKGFANFGYAFGHPIR